MQELFPWAQPALAVPGAAQGRVPEQAQGRVPEPVREPVPVLPVLLPVQAGAPGQQALWPKQMEELVLQPQEGLLPRSWAPCRQWW